MNYGALEATPVGWFVCFLWALRLSGSPDEPAGQNETAASDTPKLLSQLHLAAAPIKSPSGAGSSQLANVSTHNDQLLT